MSELVYLASPYSHPDPAVRHQRFEAVCRMAGRMMEQGQVVYSPIAHSHPISLTMSVSPVDHDFWLRQCFGVLLRSTKLAILTIDGWEASRGIMAELTFAQQHAIPVEFIAP